MVVILSVDEHAKRKHNDAVNKASLVLVEAFNGFFVIKDRLKGIHSTNGSVPYDKIIEHVNEHMLMANTLKENHD